MTTTSLSQASEDEDLSEIYSLPLPRPSQTLRLHDPGDQDLVESVAFAPHETPPTSPVVALTDGLASQRRNDIRQSWEGVVVSASQDGFDAILHDQTDSDRPDETATFALDEVSEADRDLIVEGAVFYWMIGYEKSLSGQRKNVSLIVFRRLPRWTKSELERAKARATEFAGVFGVK